MSFLITACADQKEKTDQLVELPEPEPVTEIDTISYLALGDSYTIGQGIEAAGRWPVQLSAELAKKPLIIEPTDIIARTGWTTRNLLTAIELAGPTDYDLVSLLIGVNNQYQNQAFEQFQTDFDRLLDQSIKIAGNMERVFVVSIPDYGVTPFGKSNREKIAMELDAYNVYMAQRCQVLNIPFIDITEISRSLGASPGALASDNLHPSAGQYAKWVEKILPVVSGLLGE